MFFGVGNMHPRVSLLLEVGDLGWCGWLYYVAPNFGLKCYQARYVYDGRLLRRVAVKEVKYGKNSWMKRMSNCGREFGWQEVGAEQLKNMSEAELKGMLESVAWRKEKGRVE